MITLAFAQMVYYVAIGLDRYGGDDGMTIYKRSQFGDLINLSNKTAFYYLCLVLLLRRSMSSGASSIRASAWSSRAPARMTAACAQSAFRPIGTSWSAS